MVLTLISFSEAIFFQSLEYMCWPARTKNHTVRTFLVLLLGVFENDLFGYHLNWPGQRYKWTDFTTHGHVRGPQLRGQLSDT